MLDPMDVNPNTIGGASFSHYFHPLPNVRGHGRVFIVILAFG